jgi:hypothetical protein
MIDYSWSKERRDGAEREGGEKLKGEVLTISRLMQAAEMVIFHVPRRRRDEPMR